MATARELVQEATPECAWPTMEAIEDGARRVRRAYTESKQKVEDAAAEARLSVRRHPLTSVATGLAAGACFGAVFGLVISWSTRARQ